MDWLVKLLYFSFLAYCVSGQTWEDPFVTDPGNEHVTVTPGTTIYIDVDEEQSELTIGILEYTGSVADITISSINGEHIELALVAECGGEGENCKLIANNGIDFEADDLTPDYRVLVKIKDISKNVIIRIINVDDNPTLMQLDGIDGCKVDERFKDEIEEVLTGCKYTINDLDGMLAGTTFKVIVEDPLHNYADIFEFRLDNPNIPIGDKSAKVSLYVKEGADLKYSKRSLYIFTLLISEGTLIPSEFRALIEINDIPNLPPVWAQIMSMYQFPEHETQEITIRAEDGDITIQANIEYKINGLDPMWDGLISLDATTGIITVGDIDRDVDYFKERSDIAFTVIAFEKLDPVWETDPYTITFFIIDIDDHIPEISLSGGADPDPTLFRICESKAIAIPNLNLEIDDKDLGENARYRVDLEDNQFSKAFKIIPNNGYQYLIFTLNIDSVLSNLLDYENPEWQSFNFKIQSSASTGTNSNSKEIKFGLINWNDELPIFSQPGYTVAIDETIPAGELVAKVEATDKDGPEITYSLPGGMGSILEITTDGEIKTKVNNVFDFERQEMLLVYVTATDHFDEDEEGCNSLGDPAPPNSVTVTVTVNINDINDETPVLTAIVNNEIIIEENVPDGTAVDLGTNVIEATDADKSAVLVFEIVWEESRATKSGSRISAAEFEEHVKDFLEVITDTTTVPGKAFPIFTTKEKYPGDPGKSPDYEKFHSVVLKLKVTDTDQTLAGVDNFGKADITISIEDLNDNMPIFVESTITKKMVTENAVDTTPIGTVLAEDADGKAEFNTVTYRLEPQGITPAERVQINPDTGELTVYNKDSPRTDIDCDDPKVESLVYLVYASDSAPGHETNVELIISITDLNDNFPKLTVNSPIEIPEEQDIGTEITEAGVSATDADRDEPHNVVKYSIINFEAATYFDISKTGSGEGLIKVTSKIDRENLPTNPIVVNIRATDSDGLGNIATESISITITDINDNSPQIQTTTLSATENHGPANADIGTIEIIDNDAPGDPNSQITLEILSATIGDDILDGFFAVSEPVQTGQISRSTLTALKDLKDYSGVINILLKATDKGDPSKGSIPHQTTLILIVERYNFASPVITFPIEERYYLELPTDVNFPVIEVTGEELNAIEAHDDQQNKYQVELKLLDPTSTEENEIEHPIFKFFTGSSANSPNKIYIKTIPIVNQFYEVKIKATNKEGVPVTTAEKTVQLMFRDGDEQPTFEITTSTQSIWENDADAFVDSTGTTGLPLATYGNDENPLSVIYHLQDPVAMPFKIVTDSTNKKYYAIAVDKERFENGLDRDVENGDKYEVKVIASKHNTPPLTPDEKSILTVTMNIKDRNDNAPIFTKQMYYGALLNTYSHGTKIIEVLATDLDATDIVKYSITASRGFGDAEDVIDPVLVDEASGAITLNFRVTTAMEGYIELDLLATDSLEDKQNEGKANAQIYIVSDIHRVDFKFLNTIDEVDALREEILVILQEVFSYECVYEKSNLEPEEEVVSFSVHFIDINKHEAILKQEIIDKASVVTVISSLTGKFNNIGLALKSFVDTFIFPEDLSEYYKTWLIGVGAVMGVLIVFIIIAFTFKYMGMRKQIARLTGRKFASMDSGLNRMAAPNTNTHTHDGSNPVYIQEDKERVEMPDNISMSSGDSELYGVENNPVFSNNVEKF